MKIGEKRVKNEIVKVKKNNKRLRKRGGSKRDRGARKNNYRFTLNRFILHLRKEI